MIGRDRHVDDDLTAMLDGALSGDRLAQVLGTTVPSVKSLVHRATVSAVRALESWSGEGAEA